MRLLLLVLRLGGFIDLRLVFESLFWSSEFDMSSLRYDDVSTLRCRALSCKKQGILVCSSCITSRGDVGCPHEHDG